ncbi:MAG TPA: DUF418 domain-containing protein [Sphingomonas sp.]|nr:DUF418 domain-containing protein [Sphingomonas sp.]
MATTARDRILTLDTVRGVAVMGILLLNIIAFAMPMPAYFNPAAYGGDAGIDLAVWLGNFILFDGKMRGLFSLLFGASMLLVIERAESKGENPARIHYARMVWLLVFGLIHLWLVWWGDILSHYALIGMIAFLFRKARVKTMVGIGIILLVVELAATMFLPLTVMMAQAAPGQPGMADAIEGLSHGFGTPPAAWITEQVALHRGDWLGIAIDRFGENRFMPLMGLFQFGWETLAYMLFGMAGLKSGMLTGSWERARYVRWIAVGFGIAWPVYTALGIWMISQDFSLISVTTAVMPATVPFRPLAIMAWASLIILLMRPGGALTTRIAAAGRMAFTNYLATSLICTAIFYGYGLGWYGELSRAEVYLVVLAVWAAMLLWSKPWLERFAYGPLEWLWRSLARGGAQPMAGGALVRAG